MELFTRIFNKACLDVNEQISKNFELLNNEDFQKTTHFFNGRYENIYLEVEKIPELKIIIDVALECAADILKIKKEKLALGFWLNSMGAGDVTTAHTHDDDDELLSGVYYIKVPERSGNLIITDNKIKTTIKPREGEFVFFSPSTLHEVSKNESQHSRLSIAFNFGLIRAN